MYEKIYAKDIGGVFSIYFEGLNKPEIQITPPKKENARNVLICHI